MNLHAGDIFLGEYEILHPIGAGAFAKVYRARQARLGRDVAIKFLQMDDDVARRRYEVEAKVVAQLKQPATVRVYDYGLFQNTPFMVLEFVTGKTLREVMTWQAPFSVERTINILLQILDSLAEAHALGVVHRDLKPSNIMLFQPDPATPEDRVKVLDFGLAKVDVTSGSFAVGQNRITERGVTVGSLPYMPPEQMRGIDIRPASDLFALGMMAYEMLCGRHPYQALSGAHLVSAILDPDAIELPVQFSPELRAIVNRLLRKDVEARYRNAHRVAADLRALIEPAAQPEGLPTFVQDTSRKRTTSYVTLIQDEEQSVPAPGDGRTIVHSRHTTPVTSSPPRGSARSSGRIWLVAAAIGFFLGALVFGAVHLI